MNEKRINYDSNLVKKVKEELKELDKTNILGPRLDYLSNVLGIVKGNGYGYSGIKLIEGGSGLCEYDGYQKAFVAHFFANYPDLLDYNSYDSSISKQNTGISKAVEDANYFTLDKKQILDNINSKNIEMNFWDLVKETYTDKKLVICSNYVLDIADEKFPIWNLPGLHIHQFFEDGFSLKEGSVLGKKYRDKFGSLNDVEERLKCIYKINSSAQFFKNLGENKYEMIVSYDND